jgi:triosephosphate isomerase
MRPYYLAGNWKMNKTPSEAAAYAAELKNALAGVKHRLLVAPAFVAIPGVAAAPEGLQRPGRRSEYVQRRIRGPYR